MSAPDPLYKLARQLRTTLQGPGIGEHLPMLKRFPSGCCKLSTIFYLKLLQERHGIDSAYGVVNAVRGSGPLEETHAWAEVEGQIVDITADQFDDFHQDVFVERSSTWHSSWRGMDKYPQGDLTSIDGKHLREYEAVAKRVRDLST